MKGKTLVGCPANLPLLLVLGGSLGSASINRLVLEALDRLRLTCFVVHQLGNDHFDGIASQSNYFPAAYFHDDLADINRDIDRYMAVTLEDILRVANEYFDETNRTVVIANPASEGS